MHVIPRGMAVGLGQAHTLEDIQSRLASALTDAGYYDTRYFAAKRGGFVLITRMEQITEDGAPNPYTRWRRGRLPMSGEPFSLRAYLDELLNVPPGRFRVLAFVVDVGPVERGGVADWDALDSLYSEGAAVFSARYDTVAYTPDHNLTALVYEFEKPDGEGPKFVERSEVPARVQLARSAVIEDAR